MQKFTLITLENNSLPFTVTESAETILNMIKNTMGDNFITLTLFNYSNVASDKLYIRAKSIIAVHEEEDFEFINRKE